jgi:parallel beta-helix repeat protein
LLKRIVFGVILILFSAGALALPLNMKPVKALETICIKTDGSIDPSTAPIRRNGSTYIFADNIFASIWVEAGCIIIDGAGYTLQGTGEVDGYGIGANHPSHVTIKNMHITGFWRGIYITGPIMDWTIIQNNMVNNMIGIGACHYFSFNVITKNHIESNNTGIKLSLTSEYNNITENIIANSTFGIVLQDDSGHQLVKENTVTNNEYGLFLSSSHNTIYHNNFINNINQVYLEGSPNNAWDNGCEGNYWSNYNGSDLDGDGIGDTELPWLSLDYYPLMNPYWNPADVNHDLEVDIHDVIRICAAYNSRPGDKNYNPHCDIAETRDIIDIYDVVIACANYGEKYS